MAGRRCWDRPASATPAMAGRRCSCAGAPSRGRTIRRALHRAPAGAAPPSAASAGWDRSSASATATRPCRRPVRQSVAGAAGTAPRSAGSRLRPARRTPAARTIPASRGSRPRSATADAARNPRARPSPDYGACARYLWVGPRRWPWRPAWARQARRYC
ncbi:Uncharacterised protein [Bordetella pertussis]|nr:Uncharacterised protein [Bordetella pertussis]